MKKLTLNGKPIEKIIYKFDSGSGNISDDYDIFWEINPYIGQIINWHEGIISRVCYKSRDRNFLSAYDKYNNKLGEYEGYVPDCFQIYDNGFGDYVHINVDSHGFIEDWKLTQIEINRLFKVLEDYTEVPDIPELDPYDKLNRLIEIFGSAKVLEEFAQIMSTDELNYLADETAKNFDYSFKETED